MLSLTNKTIGRSTKRVKDLITHTWITTTLIPVHKNICHIELYRDVYSSTYVYIYTLLLQKLDHTISINLNFVFKFLLKVIL